MKLSSKYLFIFLGVIFSSTTYGHTIRLVAPQFPPYTAEVEGEFIGLGIDAIYKIMDSLKQPYQLRIVPNYARALEEVRLGRADGFFLASENEKRNSIAEFSTPIMVNRWVWFLRPDESRSPSSAEFKKNAHIASIYGSNTYRWLKSNGYQVSHKSNVSLTFPSMLLGLKRIDGVFLAEKVFSSELVKQGYLTSDYKMVIQSEQPFGIYISKAYLAANPTFMTKLNQTISKLAE